MGRKPKIQRIVDYLRLHPQATPADVRDHFAKGGEKVWPSEFSKARSRLLDEQRGKKPRLPTMEVEVRESPSMAEATKRERIKAQFFEHLIKFLIEEDKAGDDEGEKSHLRSFSKN